MSKLTKILIGTGVVLTGGYLLKMSRTSANIETITKAKIHKFDLTGITVKNEKENLEELQEELKEVLQSNFNEISNLLKDKFFKEGENAKLLKKIQEIKSSINIISEELKKDIFSAEPLKEFAKLQIDKKVIKILIEDAKKKAKELTDSQKQNTKLVIYTKLFRAIEAY